MREVERSRPPPRGAKKLPSLRASSTVLEPPFAYVGAIAGTSGVAGGSLGRTNWARWEASRAHLRALWVTEMRMMQNTRNPKACGDLYHSRAVCVRENAANA